ncbi:MAG: hypothetical protein PSV35_00795 [bacterium]|nr:hypothetical protein [bacterium]
MIYQPVQFSPEQPLPLVIKSVDDCIPNHPQSIDILSVQPTSGDETLKSVKIEPLTLSVDPISKTNAPPSSPFGAIDIPETQAPPPYELISQPLSNNQAIKTPTSPSNIISTALNTNTNSKKIDILPKVGLAHNSNNDNNSLNTLTGRDKKTDKVPKSVSTKNSVIKLRNLLENSYEKIVKNIPNNEQHSSNYLEIHRRLKIMQEKSVSLLNEKNKSPIRRNKAIKMLDLTLQLAQKANVFIAKPTKTRKETAVSFSQEIHQIINDKKQGFVIDAHHNVVSRYIYTHICNFGIFRTDTRKKLTHFAEACDQLSLK